jgi:hypothetical protein
VRVDEVARESFDRVQPGALGENAQVAGAVEELVFEGQVAEQRLVDRLHLLDRGLEQRDDASDRGGHHVRWGVQVAQRALDALCPAHGVGAVLLQLTADGVGAGLAEAGPCDLSLGAGELLERPQLADDRVDRGGLGGCREGGGGVRHARRVPRLRDRHARPRE